MKQSNPIPTAKILPFRLQPNLEVKVENSRNELKGEILIFTGIRYAYSDQADPKKPAARKRRYSRKI